MTFIYFRSALQILFAELFNLADHKQRAVTSESQDTVLSANGVQDQTACKRNLVYLWAMYGSTHSRA